LVFVRIASGGVAEARTGPPVPGVTAMCRRNRHPLIAA